MFRTLRLVALLIVSATVLAPSSGAYAAGWPTADSAPVSCAYSQEYVRPDGTTAAHTGVDIEAHVGDEVLCVSEGTVSFAGSVPDHVGGTMLAVTIQTDTGEKWSYLPLERISVKSGSRVCEGCVLGRVAAAGDGSSVATHVHVGLRRGDLYVDPTSMLVAPVAQVAADAGEVPVAAGVCAQEPVTAEIVDIPAPAPGVEPAGATLHPADSPIISTTPAASVSSRSRTQSAPTEPTSCETFAHQGVRDAGVTSMRGDSAAAHVAQCVTARAEESRLVPTALLATACLGSLAALSSVQAVRGRVTALRESVAAAVGR